MVERQEMKGYFIDKLAPGQCSEKENSFALARRHPGQAGALGGLSDTALAVVVGTLTLVGVVGFFESASTTAKTNSEIANLTSLIANIRSAYYQAGADYGSVTSAGLAGSGIAPQPLIFNGGLRSMFGQAITVAPGVKDNTIFTISYSGIPQSACVKLATTVWNTIPSITGTTIGGAAPKTTDMSGAQTSCANAANTLVFTSN